MNLALLDPFRRQLPDRIDSTLILPTNFHPLANEALNEHQDELEQDQDEYGEDTKNKKTKKSKSKPKPKPKSKSRKGSETISAPNKFEECLSLSYNRRGLYLASCYKSGAVAVYDFTARTLVALYHIPLSHNSGIDRMSWSRRSRRILCASTSSCDIYILQNHREHAKRNWPPVNPAFIKNEKDLFDSPSAQEVSDIATATQSLRSLALQSYTELILPSQNDNDILVNFPAQSEPPKEFIWKNCGSSVEMACNTNEQIQITLPLPVGEGGVMLHPIDSCLGLAVTQDGSLLLFCIPFDKSQGTYLNYSMMFPLSASPPFKESSNISSSESFDKEKNEPDYIILCASYNKKGNIIFAGTDCGHLLIFDLTFSENNSTRIITPSNPSNVVEISPKSSITHIKMSRNGQCLLLNSNDGTLRLHDISSLLNAKCDRKNNVTPQMTFQDPMSKNQWISPCFSGDGEFVIAGVNTTPNMIGQTYTVYIFNSLSGALCDQLKGPQGVTLNSIACHPTRYFVSVSTSDGVLDVWGPRMDWTAFAPDFQAMTDNVEYIEMEDEFDTVVDNEDEDFVHDKNELETRQQKYLLDREEEIDVNVVTVEKVPMFDSDSEDEENVFWFGTKALNLIRLQADNTNSSEPSSHKKKKMPRHEYWDN